MHENVGPVNTMLKGRNSEKYTLMSYCLVVADEPKLKVAFAHEPLVVSMYTVKKEVLMKFFLFHSFILSYLQLVNRHLSCA